MTGASKTLFDRFFALQKTQKDDGNDGNGQLAPPLDSDAVRAAEDAKGVCLPADFKEYLTTYTRELVFEKPMIVDLKALEWPVASDPDDKVFTEAVEWHLEEAEKEKQQELARASIETPRTEWAIRGAMKRHSGRPTSAPASILPSH